MSEETREILQRIVAELEAMERDYPGLSYHMSDCGRGKLSDEAHEHRVD